ncbi:DUF4391 domain-containing protein [Puerhibacterium sp. TATVAM-FAB25]|uniref:DUF4391 domain-containing protein n=1 Tax=Puerhibacterium sp. TATVAM-FAB25 TaxID=3093699 RepID=UPI0039783FF4
MHDPRILYRWPTAAAFGRVVPKNAIYNHGAVNAAVKQRFVDDVERITWAYKLAESTLRLPTDPDMLEVQVLVLDARADDVTDSVLTAIDAAIPQPIIFEVNRTEETRMVAAHKIIGSGAPKVGSYYSTAWMPADSRRAPLPTAITLTALYAALLAPLMPVTARPGESLSEVADRLTDVRRLEREVAALERKIRTERQFNRRVELRRALLAKLHELNTTK